MFGSEGTVRISVRVHPGANRNEVTGFTDNVLHVRVAAPPVKGKANKELIDFLSRLFDVSKSQVTILRGHTARNKVVAIDGLNHEEVTKRLSNV